MSRLLDAYDRDGAFYPPRVPPTERRLSLPQFFARFVRNPLSAIPSEVYQQPVVVRALGRTTFVYVTDPALIRTVLVEERDNFPKSPLEKRVLGPLLGDGLLTSSGATWKWQRQTAAPLFRHQDLLAFVPAMTDAAEAMVREWRSDQSGRARKIDHDMMRATFAVIADTLLKDETNAVGAVVERSSASYLMPITWKIFYTMMHLPAWLPHPGKARMARSERDMRCAVRELIAARRGGTGAERDDLLARLLAARHPDSGEPMSDEQIADNLLTFFLAGHETTAKALGWTLYLVSQTPYWEQRIEDEIQAVAGTGAIGAEHIARLVTVEQVLKESMRLFPPAPVMTRTVAAATRLGAHTVPAGAMIVMPIYAIHRHSSLWRDPHRFDPMRFAPEREKELVRYQYMPFGAGPRICIGQAFAMIEAVAMLATFLRAARFKCPPGHHPEPISRITLRPRGGLPLTVVLR